MSSTKAAKTTGPRRPRPGGRSARVRAAVFAATEQLLTEKGPRGFGLVDVAECAGVAPSSLYRRWGGIEALIMNVAMEGLAKEFPLPDTGSLQGDLVAWANNIVRSLRDPAASNFFRLLVSTFPVDRAAAAHRTKAIRRRSGDLEGLLDRARKRGEKVPEATLLVDVILAPLYTRALFGERVEAKHAQQLVARATQLID
jgi:AcrR family transcriptional regulator